MKYSLYAFLMASSDPLRWINSAVLWFTDGLDCGAPATLMSECKSPKVPFLSECYGFITHCGVLCQHYKALIQTRDSYVLSNGTLSTVLL